MKGKKKTSAAAYESIQDQLARLEGMVYREIVLAGSNGACCFEIEHALDMIHQTASARITGLQEKRMIRDSAKRRTTPSGRQAIAWVVRRNLTPTPTPTPQVPVLEMAP